MTKMPVLLAVVVVGFVFATSAADGFGETDATIVLFVVGHGPLLDWCNTTTLH
jgi:hypothetical protein